MLHYLPGLPNPFARELSPPAPFCNSGRIWLRISGPSCACNYNYTHRYVNTREHTNNNFKHTFFASFRAIFSSFSFALLFCSQCLSSSSLSRKGVLSTRSRISICVSIVAIFRTHKQSSVTRWNWLHIKVRFLGAIIGLEKSSCARAKTRADDLNTSITNDRVTTAVNFGNYRNVIDVFVLGVLFSYSRSN